MSESVDITDRESLEAWLTDQPREVAVWIASRAAARVLPVWWDAVLTEEWARESEISALPILRSLIVSSVAAKLSSVDILKAAASTRSGAAEHALLAEINSASSEVARSVSAAANAAAIGQVAPIGLLLAHQAARAVTGMPDYATDLWLSVGADAEQVAGGDMPDALPLWPNEVGPLAEQWRATKWEVTNSEGSEDWQFWIEWYDALLDGRPMLGDAGRTWEMLERIALIDPATWDRGPEVVNPVIREIWELHRLRAEVAALQAEKAAVLAVRASEAQRGHNQPPEGLVDEAPEVARQITIIWDGLDEARDELERDAPDKGVLRAIAERMLAALNAVVAYCAKVADAVVMSAAKIGGGAVGTAVLDHVANNGRLMQFAKDLLAFGGG